MYINQLIRQIMLQADEAFKKKQLEDAKKLKEAQAKAKGKGPLGKIKSFTIQFWMVQKSFTPQAPTLS